MDEKDKLYKAARLAMAKAKFKEDIYRGVAPKGYWFQLTKKRQDEYLKQADWHLKYFSTS